MNERLRLSENEKLANKIAGLNACGTFAMDEETIDDLIAKERKNSFNNEVDAQMEELNKQKKAIEEYQSQIENNFSKIEIKPMFDRILVKPFACNPFQKIQVENGIITDLGGMNPKIHQNQQTGQWEEQDQMIVVGTVIEVGPECKYVREGDTVFYMKHLPTPVPFFKQGFWTIKEENLIAVVNEGLEERFKNVLGK